MKSFLRSLSSGLMAACLMASAMVASLPNHASAAVALAVQDRNSVPNWKIVAFGDVTGAYSNATTSLTDVTGSSFTYTPTVNDCTVAGRLLNIGATRPCLIRVSWSFDVTKATSLTGNCGVYVNGAFVTTSARYATFPARQSIGGVLVVANTVVGTQTIKMQCVSADSAAITVTNGHVVVEEYVNY